MASSRIAEAYVQLVPSATGFKNAIANEIDGPINDSVDNAGKKFAGLGPLIGAAFAGAAVVNFTKDIVGAAQAEVEQNARINQIASSMGLFGDQAGKVSQRLIDLAQQQALATGLDEDAIKNTQAKLLTFKNLAATADDMGGMFDRATMAAMDMAAAGFGSAESNAVALGKALNDPIGGMASLGRMGVQFTDEQKAMIEQMVGVGDVAGAQALMMKELETQVGGTAAATATAGDRMNQSWANFQETLGLLLLPTFEAVAGALAAFTTWASENLTIVIPIFAGLAAVILGALAPAIWAAITATWAFTVALLANPVTWIVLGIGLLVAAIVALAMNWDTVTKWIGDVWNTFVQWIGDGWNAIAAFFTDTWNNIANFFTTAVTNVVNFVRDYWGLILSFFIGPLGLVIQYVVNNWSSIVSFFQTSLNNIGRFFGDVFNNIGSTVRNIFQGISDFIAGVFNGIVGLVRGPINAIIGLLNGMINGLNKIKINVPDWVPLLGGKTLGFNIANIPMLANGGTVTGSGTVLVGERGPELLNLPGGASVVPLDRGAGLNVNYYAAPNESIDSEQALFQAMRRAKVVAGW